MQYLFLSFVSCFHRQFFLTLRHSPSISLNLHFPFTKIKKSLIILSRLTVMGRIILLICLLITFSSLVQQVEPRPLKAIGKTAGKLLSILGTGTYYDVGAGLGSCGKMHHDNELVVAVNHAQMKNGGNPNKNPHCGKKVKVMGKTKKAVEATIVDTCPGCSKGSLDMSPQLFKKVCGALTLGVCQIQWGFV